MSEISSCGKNSHSLFLSLWSLGCVLILPWTLISPADRSLLQPSLPLSLWCPLGVTLPRDGVWRGHRGTEAQQFTRDIPLVFWLVEKTRLQVKSCFLNQLQCVGANNQNMVSILVSFHCVGSLNSSSERFIIGWTLHFQSWLNHTDWIIKTALGERIHNSTA